MRAPLSINAEETKADTYARLEKEILSVLEGETNRTAQMATISCLLHDAFPHRVWTGFYCVDPLKPNELVVGPYQGTLGCMRIPFGKGVCGAAAASGRTQLVDNVHDFPGHIACDSRSVSEIVVPVFNAHNNLIAVFDVDADIAAQFDETDKVALEQLLKKVFSQ